MKPCDNGFLELENLNVLMGMAGVLVGHCELLFYSHSILYRVTFGPYGSFQIQHFNRFVGIWEMIMFSGTLEQATDALNSYQPFLTKDEINGIWGNVKIPPAGPFPGFIPNPV